MYRENVPKWDVSIHLLEMRAHCALFYCPFLQAANTELTNQRAAAVLRLSLVTLGDSLDWKDLSAGEITQRVTSKVQPGSIVLFHNAALHTPEALPSIIQSLLQEGYTFVPISQIILSGEYTIDHTGRQCPA